jgi:arylsulfatase A-like enzyme
MDLTATFLAAAGASPPAGRELDGINLLPHITGDAPNRARTFCWRVNRSNRKAKAIRHGDWKFIDDGGVELLINLKDDISERHDLGYRHPDVLADLKRRLKLWEDEMDRSPKNFVVR